MFEKESRLELLRLRTFRINIRLRTSSPNLFLKLHSLRGKLGVDTIGAPSLRGPIIINGSSPSHLKPNTKKNKTQNLLLHFQRSSSCTRQNTNEDKAKAMNGKVKQLREDKPDGQAQAVTTQNRYALLQDEGDQS